MHARVGNTMVSPTHDKMLSIIKSHLRVLALLQKGKVVIANLSHLKEAAPSTHIALLEVRWLVNDRGTSRASDAIVVLNAYECARVIITSVVRGVRFDILLCTTCECNFTEEPTRLPTHTNGTTH